AVLAHVRRLNAAHRWQEARATFDPAFEPLDDLVIEAVRTLTGAVILGPDEFLVERQNVGGLHLAPDRIAPLPGIRADAISPDRATLLLVSRDGFATARAKNRVNIATLPWPFAARRVPHMLCVANGGERVAFAHEELGIWVGTPRRKGGAWQRL